MEYRHLKPLFSKEDIEQRITELSRQISADFKDTHLIIIGVLKGSFIFLADLMRNLTLDVSIDFVEISSYGSFQRSSGTCVVHKNLSTDITDRDILIVEDIVDTGDTLAFLTHQFLHKSPRSIKTCALINKQARRKQHVSLDYCGFTIEDGFIVGFGLDHNEKYRSLPALYELIDSDDNR